MHLRHKVAVHVDPTFWVVVVDVLLESGETKLVPIFEVSIVVCILLHRIVCQMHESIVHVLEIDSELGGRCPQVAFFEEEQVMVLV